MSLDEDRPTCDVKVQECVIAMMYENIYHSVT